MEGGSRFEMFACIWMWNGCAYMELNICRLSLYSSIIVDFQWTLVPHKIATTKSKFLGSAGQVGFFFLLMPSHQGKAWPKAFCFRVVCPSIPFSWTENLRNDLMTWIYKFVNFFLAKYEEFTCELWQFYKNVNSNIMTFWTHIDVYENFFLQYMLS